MRPLWAQAAAGALVVVATVGVVVLPGRLLGTERSTELPLLSVPPSSVIQAHTVHVPVRKQRLTITPVVVRAPVADHVVSTKPAPTVQTSFVVHRTTAPRHVGQPKVATASTSSVAPTPPAPTTTAPTPPAPTTTAPTPPTTTPATPTPAPVVDASQPAGQGVPSPSPDAKTQKHDQHGDKPDHHDGHNPSLPSPLKQLASPQQPSAPASTPSLPSPPPSNGGNGQGSDNHGGDGHGGHGDDSSHGHDHHR